MAAEPHHWSYRPAARCSLWTVALHDPTFLSASPAGLDDNLLLAVDTNLGLTHCWTHLFGLWLLCILLVRFRLNIRYRKYSKQACLEMVQAQSFAPSPRWGGIFRRMSSPLRPRLMVRAASQQCCFSSALLQKEARSMWSTQTTLSSRFPLFLRSTLLPLLFIQIGHVLSLTRCPSWRCYTEILEYPWQSHLWKVSNTACAIVLCVIISVTFSWRSNRRWNMCSGARYCKNSNGYMLLVSILHEPSQLCHYFSSTHSLRTARPAHSISFYLDSESLGEGWGGAAYRWEDDLLMAWRAAIKRWLGSLQPQLSCQSQTTHYHIAFQWT